MIEKAILRTLVYADIFSYPLTLFQIHKFLISSKKIGVEEVERCLEKLVKNKKIEFRKGFYFLPQRDLVRQRLKRKKISERKIRMAKKIAFLLKLVPFVKLVGITGRLAVKNAEEDDDLDFLLITAKNRLWLTRIFVVFLLEFFGLRRRYKEEKARDKVCLNLFLEEGFLSLPRSKRNLYTAHEIVQINVLWEREEIYRKFLGANQWVKKYLANAVVGEREEEIKEGGKKGIWDFFESLAYRFQFWYMKRHKTREKVSFHYAFFHPQPVETWVLEKYRKKLLPVLGEGEITS